MPVRSGGRLDGAGENMLTAVDATALGSGRGGDETSLRGILAGLAQVVPGRDHLLYVRPGATMPAAVREASAFRTCTLRRSDGPIRLGLELPLRLRRDRPDVLLSLTHAPIGDAVPVALLVADLSFLRCPEHYPAATRHRLRLLVGRQVPRAAAVLTVSEYSRQDLVSSYQLDPDRVFVVPNPIDEPQEMAPAALVAARGRLAARGVDGPIVLYLGNLHPRKNVPRLIEAFVRARRGGDLRDHTLVVAGARWWGDGERRAAAQADAGSVALVGYVDEAEREWLLRSATMLAYPSLFEGFGLPPLEAMIRGTPVVTSNVTSLPEVTAGAAVLVDPLDVDDIAAAMAKVAADEVFRATLVEAGLIQARTFTHRRTGLAAAAALDAAG